MKRERKRIIITLIGVVLILAGLGWTAYNMWLQSSAGAASEETLTQLSSILPETSVDLDAVLETIQTDEAVQEPGAETASGEPSGVPDKENLYDANGEFREHPVVTIDGRDYVGIITIPSLDIELPVLNEWSYANLRVSPCRMSGSAFTKDLVLLAHNYNTHFGQIKTLDPGDVVIFTDMDGTVFVYEVDEQQILAPTAVDYVTSSDWDLTMFTCTIGGRTRVVVRLNLMKIIEP